MAKRKTKATDRAGYWLPSPDQRGPLDLTGFEAEAKPLRLLHADPEAQADNRELCAWVRRWNKTRYVPEPLLGLLGLQGLWTDI